MTSQAHGSAGVYGSKYYTNQTPQNMTQQLQPTYQPESESTSTRKPIPNASPQGMRQANNNNILPPSTTSGTTQQSSSDTNNINNQQQQQQQQQIPFDKLQLMSKLKMNLAVVGPLQSQMCWICGNHGDGNTSNSYQMFKPCACGPAVHRTCWWNWHRASMSTKTWWSCPTCLRDYRYETLPGFDADSANEQEIIKEFQIQLLLFYLASFLILSLTIAFFVLVSYFGDREKFNVPIGMTYLLTSVVEGVPTSNTTRLWQQEFASGDKLLWPYYLLLSVICTSVLIIVTFLGSLIYEKLCDDDDWEDDEFKFDSHGQRVKRHHKRAGTQNCSQQCQCYNGGGFMYCWLCSNMSRSSTTSGGTGRGCASCCETVCNPNCFDTCCSPCSCNCPESGTCGWNTIHGDKCKCDKCPDCGGGGGGGGGDNPVFAIIAIVVIIAIIISAVVIIIYVATTRFAKLHAAITEALYCRSAELHGKMIVLGEGETIRTSDEV